MERDFLGIWYALYRSPKTKRTLNRRYKETPLANIPIFNKINVGFMFVHIRKSGRKERESKYLKQIIKCTLKKMVDACWSLSNKPLRKQYTRRDNTHVCMERGGTFPIDLTRVDEPYRRPGSFCSIEHAVDCTVSDNH